MHKIAFNLSLSAWLKPNSSHEIRDTVELFLELRILLIHCCHESCHVTKDEGCYYRPDDNNQKTINCTEGIYRKYITSKEKQNRVIVNYGVLVPHGLFIKMTEAIVGIIRRYPVHTTDN